MYFIFSRLQKKGNKKSGVQQRAELEQRTKAGMEKKSKTKRGGTTTKNESDWG
jgi:hypothetical protein